MSFFKISVYTPDIYTCFCRVTTTNTHKEIMRQYKTHKIDVDIFHQQQYILLQMPKSVFPTSVAFIDLTTSMELNS